MKLQSKLIESIIVAYILNVSIQNLRKFHIITKSIYNLVFSLIIFDTKRQEEFDTYASMLFDRGHLSIFAW